MRTACFVGLGLSFLLALTQCSAGGAGDRPGSGVDVDVGGSSGGSSAGTGSGLQPGSAGKGGGSISLGGTSNSASGNGGSGGGSTEDLGSCGDSVLQAAALGEACDDGNSDSGDGCSADCKLVEQDYSCLDPGMPCTSTVACGDGKLSGAETCDDGNLKDSDGCSATCALEPGWSCPAADEPCVAAACGDGIVAGVEQCEDDDAAMPADADGCSATCTVEPGYVCETAGQPCRKAQCGDAVAEGGEPCDDGNTVVGDGCSPGCQAEPVCTKPTDADGCSSACGDGMLLDGDTEECDDGNKRDGDGCSSSCEVEDGYVCEKEQGAPAASITIPFVFRDFIAFPSATTTLKRHPDFQARCLGQQANNMVNLALDMEGKPVNSGTCNLAAGCTLTNGYMDPAGGNCDPHEACGAPAAFDGCDQLHGLHPIAGHPGDPFSFWYRTSAGVNKEKVVQTTLNLNGGAYTFNSGALFPFDADGFFSSGDELKRGSHNFGFTTEVRRWFQFDGGELLTFNGDDDVWVFINGQLALDIGGVHAVTERTIRLNANGTVDCRLGAPGAQTFDQLQPCATSQRDLMLIQGKVYEIALFHAERHSEESNFRLSLTGFVSVKSKCKAVCGDNVQTPGEACDNGDMNGDAAYGGCTTTCKRGPRCGDGMQQIPQEECDDGRNITPYSANGQGCTPGCKLPSSCGDGKIDSLFGEQCDEGTAANSGGYGGCNPDCTLGPRCGDKHLDTPTETCDDGNTVSRDGCSATCMKEKPK